MNFRKPLAGMRFVFFIPMSGRRSNGNKGTGEDVEKKEKCKVGGFRYHGPISIQPSLYHKKRSKGI